jgi:hypothetical protein
MQQPLRGLDRLSDLPAVRSRARQARRLLAAGRL